MTQPRTYPIKHKMTLLRPADGGVFEERQEVWLQTGEMRCDCACPGKLVISEKTGRTYRRTRRVAAEDVEDNPKDSGRQPNEALGFMSPDDFMWEYFEQLSGDKSPLEIVGVSPLSIEEATKQ